MAKTNQIFDWPQNEIENNDIITYYRHHEPILTGSKVKGNRFTPHEPYEDLKTNILSRYPAGTIRSILFNGIRHGGGCTTTTVNFAHSLASDSRNKVLLIDVNLRTPRLHKVFQDKHLQELADLVAEGGHLVSQIEKTGRGNLYAISCGGGSLCGPMGQVCLHFIKMPCGDRFFKHALLVVEDGLNRQSALSAIQMNKKDMLCI